MKLDFSRQILEKAEKSYFIKIHPEGAGFPCRQTEMTELIVAFGNFAMTLKKKKKDGESNWEQSSTPP
jgi:hypothetical protein